MTLVSPTPNRATSGSSFSSNPSPIRSSPLSNPPVFAPTRTPSPSQIQVRAVPIPRSTQSHIPNSSRYDISSSPKSPTSPPFKDQPPNQNQSTPSPPLSRSHPLLGSYQLSLLHSRMSHAHQPHSIPSTSTSGFTLHLNAIGIGRTCPVELKARSPISIPFSATYYDLENQNGSPSQVIGKKRGASQTPWVGNIDFEQYFFDQYDSKISHSIENDSPPPNYPGLRVAPVGQLQVIIKTSTSPIKAFVIPYDLRDLPVGGRMLAREKSVIHLQSDQFSISPISSPNTSPNPNSSHSPNLNQSRRKESLRYAYQLQFICVASSRSSAQMNYIGASTSRQTSRTRYSTKSEDCEKEYYLSKSLKLVFTSCPPEKDEKMITERINELVPPPDLIAFQPDLSEFGYQSERSGKDFSSFSPGSIGNRGEEWSMVRRKWYARREMENDRDHDLGLDLRMIKKELSLSSSATRVGRGGDIEKERISINPLVIEGQSELQTPRPDFERYDTPSSRSNVDQYEIVTRASISLPTTARPGTPTPQPFNIPIDPSNTVNSNNENSATQNRPKTPNTPSRTLSPRFARRKTRRGSQDERELSDRLRLMDVRSVVS